MDCASGTLDTGAAIARQLVSREMLAKSCNESANSPSLVASSLAENLGGLPGDKPEEGGDDASGSSWPRPGLHTCCNGAYRAANPRGGANLTKTHRSPDRSLQLDSVKSESLVIGNQNVTVNTFPGLVHTARHTMGVDCTRSG